MSDKKLRDPKGNWTAQVLTAQDYYSFGMTMGGTNGRSYTEGEKYRYSFNGKEDDTESGIQDYGMRMYDKSLGRFLSVDPLTSKYPELTPYQFASNTPIMAVDLDGLEAAIVAYSYRVTAMIVTGSYSGGAVVDAHGRVKCFRQWTAGAGFGAFAGGGFSVGIFPTAQADELMGWGVNFGANVGLPLISFGIDINVSPQPRSVQIGVTGGLKPGSLGPGGAEVHFDVGKATPFLEFNVYDITNEQVKKLSEAFGITIQQALNYLEYLKAASLPLKALLDDEKINKKETAPQKKSNSNTKSTQQATERINKTHDAKKKKSSNNKPENHKPKKKEPDKV